MSYDNLQTALSSMGHPEDIVRTRLKKAMYEQIELTFESVRSQLKMNKACFEIFGFDFLVDSDLQTWLLEVNSNPCYEEASPLLQSLVPRMINDAMKLTIDQVFLPKKGQPSYDKSEINVFEVPGYKTDENMWELLLNLAPAPVVARPKTQS